MIGKVSHTPFSTIAKQVGKHFWSAVGFAASSIYSNYSVWQALLFFFGKDFFHQQLCLAPVVLSLFAVKIIVVALLFNEMNHKSHSVMQVIL